MAKAKQDGDPPTFNKSPISPTLRFSLFMDPLSLDSAHFG